MITRDYDEDFRGNWIYWIQVWRFRIPVSYGFWRFLRFIPRSVY